MKINQTEVNEKFIKQVYLANIHREPPDKDLDYWVEALRTTHSPQDVHSEISSCIEATLYRKSKLFTYPGHFYSPIVDKDEALTYFEDGGGQRKSEVESVPGVYLDKAKIRENWQDLLPFMQSNPFPEKESPQYRYSFNNDSFSFGDAYSFNAILRKFAPKRVIEVGCGWSSACLLDTLKYQSSNDCRTMFIEPYPDLLHQLMGPDPEKVEILSLGVQKAPMSVFEELGSGDILFIDSTHVMKTNSDVHFEFFEILPRLKSGVLVHFHDIFWPFEYPRQWVVEDNRSWNEIYGLRALLTNNSAWEIFMFNDYAATALNADIAESVPNFLKNSGGSFWMIKT